MQPKKPADHSPKPMPTAVTALKGRAEKVETDEFHIVSGNPLDGPFPAGFQTALFAMGCYWGVERLFWCIKGVWVTAVGFAGGFTPNPLYLEVKSGDTGHAEVVRVVFDPAVVSYEELLKVFWENQNPTQGMQQGLDEGTQYRSVIFYYDDTQKAAAEHSRDVYQVELDKNKIGKITTEILPAPTFYFAHGDHQGYLVKMPGGYCGCLGTGVACPIGADPELVSELTS